MTAHTDDRSVRAQTIAGLRALADFLETNPTVPVHVYGREYSYHVHADSETAARLQVDRIAAALGVQVDDDTGRGGHYWAARTFGLITYRVVHIPARCMAAHRAHMSYAANVIPDDAAADDSPAEAA